jgi:hypothetical protein
MGTVPIVFEPGEPLHNEPINKGVQALAVARQGQWEQSFIIVSRRLVGPADSPNAAIRQLGKHLNEA